MADYSAHEEITKRKIYTLQTPSNWAELSKMFSAVSNEFGDRETSDDVVTVDVGDDEVRMIFEPDKIVDLRPVRQERYYDRIRNVLNDMQIDNAGQDEVLRLVHTLAAFPVKKEN